MQSTESNIKELSTYPGFNLQLDLKTLLTLHVENQHAFTHFKRDTFSLYEYALIFGSSIEEAVKHISKWAATYYTHPGSYYKLPTTGAVLLPRIHIPKPPASQVTRNKEAQMRAWEVGEAANVQQDNTKDRAGTLPLNLYKTETTLNPLNLQLLTTSTSDPSEDLDNNELSHYEQTEEQFEDFEPVDTFSNSDSSDDDSESALDQSLHTAIN